MSNNKEEPVTEASQSAKPVEETQEAKGKQAYYLYMFYPRFKETIDREDVMTVINELGKIESLSKDEIVIDLILSSVGGNAHAAYKIVRIVRDKCSEMNMVVPLFAKSAATLMALGGDRIYMAPQSELGPLDLPMEHPTEEQIQISALDGVRPVDYFAGVGVKIIKRLYNYYRNKEGLARKTAIEYAQRFASAYVAPIVSKLDPIIVNMCYRELEIAEDYGQELLETYMFASDDNRRYTAQRIMSKLVWGYKSHSYAICYDEAKKMGLKVFSNTEYKDWEHIWERFLVHKKEGNKVILIQAKGGNQNGQT